MNLTSLGERCPPYLRDGTMSLLPHGFGVHEQYQCTQLFLLHLPYPDFFSWRCQLGVKEKAHFWKLDTTLLEARRSYVEWNTCLCNNRHRVRQLCLSTSLVHFSSCSLNNRWFAYWIHHRPMRGILDSDYIGTQKGDLTSLILMVWKPLLPSQLRCIFTW